MKVSTTTILLSILFFLNSCSCNDLECPAFDRNYGCWLTYSNNQTITFTDNTNDIVLTINDKSFSGSYVEEVEWSSLGGCHTNHDCVQRAYVEGGFNTNINSRNDYYFSVRNLGASNQLRTLIVLFDFRSGFKVKPELELTDTLQNFYSNINLNGTDYTNVISMELDTLLAYNDNKHIWKVYFSEEKGIIAFADRNADKTYYLK